MPPVTTYFVLVSMSVYALVLLVELVRERRAKRILLEATGLVVAAAFLHLTTGFPRPSPLRAFGGLGPLPVIGLMFVGVLLGTIARYFFYLRTPFSWISLIKPLCVSPIVLLPLLGTLYGVTEAEPVQIASFCLLAFQNGFFWRIVFDRARIQS